MERPQKRPSEMSYLSHNIKKRNMAENSKFAIGATGTTTTTIKGGKLVSKLPEITDSIERKVKSITISNSNGVGLKPLKDCDINVIKNQALANNRLILNKQQEPVAQDHTCTNPFLTAKQTNRIPLSNKLNKQELTIKSKQQHQAEPLVITIDDEEELNNAKIVEPYRETYLKPPSPTKSNLTTIENILEEESNTQQSTGFATGELIDFSDPATYYRPPKGLSSRPGINDHDRHQIRDVCSEPHYAWDIFEYYRMKEESCLTVKYLSSPSKSGEINPEMRAVLVDWMVEVQESFELNHETLYLSVKIMDQYLMKKPIKKSQFQLLGITCLLIAAKFDERIPPAIDDFVYSCDSAFSKKQVIHFEIEVLKALDFFIGFPLSYRFLRRFARCGDLNFHTLTLARYILEMSLMEYDLVDQPESKVAAAALFLAIEMLHLGGWNETLEFYTGYFEDDLMPLLFKLNDMISAPVKPHLKTIRIKYEHEVFLEVAKVKPLPSR